MRAALQNTTVQEGLAVLLAGLALGAYSLISFYTGAVHVAWILSPWLFPLLLSVFAVMLGAALLCGGCRETAQSRSDAPAAPDRSGRMRALAVVLMAAACCALLPLIRFIPASALLLAALMYFLSSTGVQPLVQSERVVYSTVFSISLLMSMSCSWFSTPAE